MQTNQEIESQILAILCASFQRTTLSLEEPLEMSDVSSIQILTAIAKLGTTFAIEIEDNLIFHGLFSSARSVCTYILQKLSILSRDEGLGTEAQSEQ